MIRFIQVQNGYIDIDSIVSARSGANKDVVIITDVTGERHTFNGNMESLISLLDDDIDDVNLNKIADHYGLDSQLSMLQEECAELIQAVNKYRRKDNKLPFISDKEGIIEEIADVEIMIEQIKYLNTDAENRIIEKIRDGKLDRQIQRIIIQQEAEND